MEIKKFISLHRAEIIVGLIVSTTFSIIILLIGFLSDGFHNIYPLLERNIETIITVLISTATVSIIFIIIVNIKLNKFSQDIKRLIEINPVGKYKEISINAVSEYEKSSKEVLIITDTFKFENKNAMKNPVIEEMRSHFKEIILKNYEIDVSGEGSRSRRIKYKYKFIFPESKFNELKGYIEKNILQGAQKETINENITSIKDDYFNILRPFPERTYIVCDSDYETSIVCDMPDDGSVIYEIHESSPEKTKRFKESFNRMFLKEGKNIAK